MAKKNSPGRANQVAQKIALLAELMIDAIDDLYKEGEGGQTLRASLEITKNKCEDLVGSVYKVEEIQKSTYFTDMANKIDTLIRRNYENI